MSRLLTAVLLVAALGGGWYFYKHYEVDGLAGLSVTPRGEQSPGGSPQEPSRKTKPLDREAISIATFNLGPLDARRLADSRVVGHLVRVIGSFDVVAVQNIQDRNRSVVVGLVDQINAAGRDYDFAVAKDPQGEQPGQYSAFLFDRASVQIDRSTVYKVEDPRGRFRREPLTASFRAIGPAESEAFTFTLINVHSDPDQVRNEWALLDDVFRAVRDSRHGEDDVILLGDLGGDESRLGPLEQLPNLVWCVSGVPTTLRESRPVDNILFDRKATVEFTARGGVMDLMGELKLSKPEVLKIVGHFPVWAEFSVYERGQAGHVPGHP